MFELGVRTGRQTEKRVDDEQAGLLGRPHNGAITSWYAVAFSLFLVGRVSWLEQVLYFMQNANEDQQVKKINVDRPQSPDTKSIVIDKRVNVAPHEVKKINYEFFREHA